MPLSNFQIFLLLSVLKILVVLVITLTAVAYTVLVERKVIGLAHPALGAWVLG